MDYVDSQSNTTFYTTELWQDFTTFCLRLKFLEERENDAMVNSGINYYQCYVHSKSSFLSKWAETLSNTNGHRGHKLLETLFKFWWLQWLVE